MLDWSKPLEAVRKDGTATPAALEKTDGSDWLNRLVRIDGETFWSDSAGNVPGTGFFIRNVAKKPAWRTRDEQLDRMDALLQRLAKPGVASHDLCAEARDILAAREPVDPDIAIAAQICDRSPYDLTGLNEQRTATINAQIREAVLAGIKYGRASAGA